MSLTPADRAALWAVRADALHEIAQHAADTRARLEEAIAQSRERQREFHEAMKVGDFDRLSEIATWFQEYDDEVGQLKALVQELDALHQEIEANPTMPTLPSPDAR